MAKTNVVFNLFQRRCQGIKNPCPPAPTGMGAMRKGVVPSGGRGAPSVRVGHVDPLSTVVGGEGDSVRFVGPRNEHVCER